MPRLTTVLTPIVLIAVGGMGLATAQSSSPFASKKKQQAWETPSVPTSAPSIPVPQAPSAPAGYGSSTPNYSAPSSATSYPAPSHSNPVQASSDSPIVTTAPIRTAPPSPPLASSTPTVQYGGGSSLPPQGTYIPPQGRFQPPKSDFGQPSAGSNYGLAGAQPSAPTGSAYGSGQYTPEPRAPQSAPSPQYDPQYAPQYQPGQYEPGQYQPGQYQPSAQSAQAPFPPQGSYTPPQGGPTSYPAPQEPQSWSERLGLKNIKTFFTGGLRAGAAATYRDVAPNQVGPEDGWGDDYIFDGDVELDVSAITQKGLEYGVNLGVRAQYDPFRRGFGGRVPLCPPDIAGCSASGTNSLRGHTSQFYQFGLDDARETQIQLESAHLFLRSAYGDVTIGRDDGAAYLFSLGAPTLLAVNASNSPVDYTGLDSVKTVNDASGFSEKITYTSPRLLGDQIGVGVQIGASYALDAEACGVDFCSDRDITRVIAPDLEDVVEVGIALDRTFANGFAVEGTGTYARASEVSGALGLDDLESWGAGLEFEYANWTLGGSYLQSNNGLLDGDYTAYDIGLTWKPSDLGFSLAYGRAQDDNVGLVSDQATFGVTYDFDRFTLGTGVQYVDRTVTGLIPQGADTFISGDLDQQGTSIFVEAAVKF